MSSGENQIHIRHAGEDRTVTVPNDVLLSSALRASGLKLDMRCRGRGTCGACRVLVQQKENSSNPVLACQTYVADQMHVEVPSSSMVQTHGKISDDFTCTLQQAQSLIDVQAVQLPRLVLGDHRSALQQLREALPASMRHVMIDIAILNRLDQLRRSEVTDIAVLVDWQAQRVVGVEQADDGLRVLGLAVDIGTTTVVAMLVDLISGEVLARQSAYNQQMRQADDVASRIAWCGDEAAVQEMQHLIVNETINPLIDSLCQEASVNQDQMKAVCCAGNTVMMHLLLGLDPTSMGVIPFQPLVRAPAPLSAERLGLHVSQQSAVHVVPAMSAYVGGDIIAGVHVTDLYQSRETTLLVDIGTNGEMVLVDEGRVYVCSTPAGPAFEGSGVAFGCRAANGAIESCFWSETGDLQWSVIGDAPANGICGSAYIDFIATGFLHGAIDSYGHFNKRALESLGRLCTSQDFCEDARACVICKRQGDDAESEDIVISEKDIAVILQAKAAIYSGIVTLLEVAGKSVVDVQRLILAGGFARHLSKDNAIHLGMIPALPLERIEVVGNASLAGACQALLDKGALDQMQSSIEGPQIVELNQVKGFENHYVDALVIPNLDEDCFPETLHLQEQLLDSHSALHGDQV